MASIVLRIKRALDGAEIDKIIWDVELRGDGDRASNLAETCALSSRYRPQRKSYVGHDMTQVLNINPRIARRCLHAGQAEAANLFSPFFRD